MQTMLSEIERAIHFFKINFKICINMKKLKNDKTEQTITMFSWDK